MPNKTKNQTLITKAKHHKLVLLLSFILLIIIGNFVYNKYLDWDNAQMIKGLSRDFPVLIEQIEQETGLDLEIKSNCMTTTEKFSSGVSTCEYLVINNNLKGEKLKSVRSIVLDSEVFKNDGLSENRRVYEVEYRNKNSCTLSNLDRLYISCLAGVRDANKPKIKELLN